MVDGRRRDQWTHTADLMALLANCHRSADVDPFRRADFDPYADEADRRREPDFVTDDISILRPLYEAK